MGPLSVGRVRCTCTEVNKWQTEQTVGEVLEPRKLRKARCHFAPLLAMAIEVEKWPFVSTATGPENSGGACRHPSSSAERAVVEHPDGIGGGVAPPRGWCYPSTCWASRYGAGTVTWRVTEAALPHPSVVVSLTV